METKNKIWKMFWLSIVFLAGGFLSGFLSLILSVFIQFTSPSAFLLPTLLVISEEISKLVLIIFLVGKTKLSKLVLVLNCLLLGVGFGGFEFMLIYFRSKAILQNFVYTTPIFLIHIVTAILLGLGISKIKTDRLVGFSVCLLALFIHLTYNLIIINNLYLHF